MSIDLGLGVLRAMIAVVYTMTWCIKVLWRCCFVGISLFY